MEELYTATDLPKEHDHLLFCRFLEFLHKEHPAYGKAADSAAFAAVLNGLFDSFLTAADRILRPADHGKFPRFRKQTTLRLCRLLLRQVLDRLERLLQRFPALSDSALDRIPHALRSRLSLIGTDSAHSADPRLPALLPPEGRALQKRYLALLTGLSAAELPAQSCYADWCFLKLSRLLQNHGTLQSQTLLRMHRHRVELSHSPEEPQFQYRAANGDSLTLTRSADGTLRLHRACAGRVHTSVFLPHGSICPPPASETIAGIYSLHPTAEAVPCRFPCTAALPFLPEETAPLEQLLEELLTAPPDLRLRQPSLPTGVEQQLAHVDWSKQDVLVGSLRNRSQLDICLQHKFYHAPVCRIPAAHFPLRYVALYQSRSLFGRKSGVRYYGEVTACETVRRREIPEIPRSSDELYYRFAIKEWKKRPRPISVGDHSFAHLFTNLFLLEHSADTSGLSLGSAEEFRFYGELTRLLHHIELNDSKAVLGFLFGNAVISFDSGCIRVLRNRQPVASYPPEDYLRTPGTVFRQLYEAATSPKNMAQAAAEPTK